MSRIFPFHTDAEAYTPQQREVYHNHNHSNCPSGKQIKSEDRKSGSGGKELCDECIALV